MKINERTLSPTAINTYLSCPRKFYFRYIEKRKSRPSIHLNRGQIVHRTLHEFHKNHPKLMPATPISAIREELITTFNRLWNHAGDQLRSLNLDENEIESFRSESERMLFNFSHWLLKNELKVPDFSELRLFSKHLKLLGIIDAVHHHAGQPIIVDYKTSKNAIVTDDMTRQAAIYALLYKDKFDKTPESVWIHFLVTPGDPIPIHVDEHLVDYGKILIESVREKTISEDKRDYPCTCGGFCERDLK